jgi:hypothetical protein
MTYSHFLAAICSLPVPLQALCPCSELKSKSVFFYSQAMSPGSTDSFAQWLRFGNPLWASVAVKAVLQTALVPIDLGNASGRQMFDLLGAIATGVRERIRERIKDGLA